MKSMQANSQTIAVVLIIFAAASGLAFKQSMASSTVPGQSDQQSIDIARISRDLGVRCQRRRRSPGWTAGRLAGSRPRST